MIYRSIFVLTGAGISAPSGLSTFRDQGGLWNRHDLDELATPHGFARDPDKKVHEFYNHRRREAAEAKPNAAHMALARFEHAFTGDFLLVTQNIDGLHEAAGSTKLLHIHGALNSALCSMCGNRSRWVGDMDTRSVCPDCKEVVTLRSDVVWFGEMPYHMETIEAALQAADLFVSIGTSGSVYPAAGFALLAKTSGARAVELNLKASSPGMDVFDDVIEGDAVETVERVLVSLTTY